MRSSAAASCHWPLMYLQRNVSLHVHVFGTCSMQIACLWHGSTSFGALQFNTPCAEQRAKVFGELVPRVLELEQGSGHDWRLQVCGAVRITHGAHGPTQFAAVSRLAVLVLDLAPDALCSCTCSAPVRSCRATVAGTWPMSSCCQWR